MTILSRKNKFPRPTLVVAALLLGCFHQLQAQQVGLWYDTELQITPDGKTNHVNLLYLSTDYLLNDQFRLSAATISIAKTREESLLDDLQVFSNIEADNLPLTLAVAGIGWSPNDRHSLFVGIRNVNEDYFISPVTSLFTNSSCGIFPTLGCNMDVANYPLASVGIHYAYTAPSFNLLASLYNGQGYNRWTGRDNFWRVAPQSDGLFMIMQADWTLGGGQYFLGTAVQTRTPAEASARGAIWGYTEQQLTPRLALIADYSHAFGSGCSCTDFAGLGAQYTQGKSTLGVFTDYVRFRGDKEWATELTYKHDITSAVSLQASYHLISHDSWQTVGLFRVSVRL